jgi:transposase
MAAAPQLAYVGSDDQIYIAEADGSNPRQITRQVSGLSTEQGWAYRWPTYSPDGKRLAFAGFRTAPTQLASAAVLTADVGQASATVDDLRSEATRVRNQLHALLLRAEPGYELRLKSALKRASGVARLEQYVAPQDGPIARAREAAVRRLAMRLRLLLEQTEALAKQIRALAAPRYTPLAELPGVDLLTAGALASILGPRSFPDEAALSAYPGVAPLEASSGERVRHRLTAGGDRQFNALVHRIAIAQLRVAPAAKTYVSRRRSEGKTWREAVRALKRYIVRAVWHLWQRCHSDPGPAPIPRLAT